jgi:hypothetical protein
MRPGLTRHGCSALRAAYCARQTAVMLYCQRSSCPRAVQLPTCSTGDARAHRVASRRRCSAR